MLQKYHIDLDLVVEQCVTLRVFFGNDKDLCLLEHERALMRMNMVIYLMMILPELIVLHNSHNNVYYH